MHNRNHLQRATQFRAAEENGERYIEGYFAVFGDRYDMGYGMSESIDPHAFDRTIHDDVRVLVNHDTTLVLGRTSAGTAELRVDDHGLWGRVKINPADTDAMNAWARAQRGDVDQASFGFDIISEEQEKGVGTVHWTLKEVKLYEVSLCTFPAYESTSLSARADERRNSERRKFDAWKSDKQEVFAKWH